MKKIIFLLLLLLGCRFMDKSRADFLPPELASLSLCSADHLEITFSEPVQNGSLNINVQDGFQVAPLAGTDSVFSFTVTPTLGPGQAMTVSGSVKDVCGNTLNFLRTLYGPNPRIPGMIINELIVQGSATHPDCIEFRILKEGNTGGVTIFFGAPQTWSFRFILPAIEVKVGDYLIFHCKPGFTPIEITETVSRDLSGGLDSHPEAWDIWPQEVWALNGNNGLVTVSTAPDGDALDCFLYSIRTSDSDENYGGFGSKDLWESVQWLHVSGHWIMTEDRIYPENAFNPTGTTSTRTISRASSGADTNSMSDWHITPTKGATMGYANNDQIYTP